MSSPVAQLLLMIGLAFLTLGCDRANKEPATSQPNASASQNESQLPAESQRVANDSNSKKEKINLQIVVEGYEVGVGQLRVALYDNPQEFNKVERAKWKDVFAADAKPIQIALERELFPNNELAVAVYQDSNSNNQLDKNTFGIPQESYGFSNNPKRGFGPPKYSEVVVPISSEELSLTITLK